MKKRLLLVGLVVAFMLNACGETTNSKSAPLEAEEKTEISVANNTASNAKVDEQTEMAEEGKTVLDKKTDEQTVVSEGKDDQENEEQILSKEDMDMIADRKTISIMEDCLIGIKDDGTIIADGKNQVGECEVSGWENVVSVDTSGFHSVGLKSDGTVISTVPGKDPNGISKVEDWNNIVAISAGQNFTVGLKGDGTVVATGDNSEGECDVSGWRNIISIAAGYNRTIGLCRNGRVVATGENRYGECNVSDWTDIISIYAGTRQTIGIKEDGTVVTAGDYTEDSCDVSDWTDIIAVAPGRDTSQNLLDSSHNYIIGLKSDGTVVATGYDEQGQCDVSDWNDIVAITADYNRTIGLKKDGSIVYTGSESKYIEEQDWTGIRIPDSYERQEEVKKIIAKYKNEPTYSASQDGEDQEKGHGETGSFSNAYGSPTTKCAHPGCNNPVASSGDTNCCTVHSNRCADCGKYIDEDAMYCMDCLYKASGQSTGNGTNSNIGAGGYEMPNENDKSFSDYVKRVDPDLYDELFSE